MSNSNSSSGGIGFAGLLTIVFIVLKLIDKIDWSWWWVLSPIWISASIAVIIIVFLFLLEKNMRDKQRNKRLKRYEEQIKNNKQ